MEGEVVGGNREGETGEREVVEQEKGNEGRGGRGDRKEWEGGKGEGFIQHLPCFQTFKLLTYP